MDTNRIKTLEEAISKKVSEFLEKLPINYQTYDVRVAPDGTFDFYIVVGSCDSWVDVEFEDVMVFDFEDEEIAIWWDLKYVKGEKAKKAFFNHLFGNLAERINDCENKLSLKEQK